MRRLAFLMAVALALATGHAQAQTPPPTATAISLAQLEELALKNNPTGTAAAAGIEAARARTRQAGAFPNPVIGYSGEELKTGDRGRRGEHGFFVEQTIPLWGKLRLSRNVFQKTIEQAEAVRDLQRLRIRSSVRQAFYAVLLTERRIEVQERLAALASEADGVTAQLFNVGAADRPDYLQIEIESRRLQLQLNRTRNERFALRAQLAALTGVREVADRPLAGSIDTALPNLEREQIVRMLLDQSPELRAARADLERTRAVTARARREASPDLFLRGGGAYNREFGEDTGRPIGWEGTHAGHAMPTSQPSATPPAKTPASAADPHGGHTMAGAATASKGVTTQKPAPSRPSKPAAADSHAGPTPRAAPATKPAPAATKPENSRAADPHAAHASVKPADKQRDPVNGLVVDPATAPKTTYQGQAFYFSSEQSRKEFLENPAKFTKRPKG
jgi:YHS domain-containing protein